MYKPTIKIYADINDNDANYLSSLNVVIIFLSGIGVLKYYVLRCVSVFERGKFVWVAVTAWDVAS